MVTIDLFNDLLLVLFQARSQDHEFKIIERYRLDSPIQAAL